MPNLPKISTQKYNNLFLTIFDDSKEIYDPENLKSGGVFDDYYFLACLGKNEEIGGTNPVKDYLDDKGFVSETFKESVRKKKIHRADKNKKIFDFDEEKKLLVTVFDDDLGDDSIEDFGREFYKYLIKQKDIENKKIIIPSNFLLGGVSSAPLLEYYTKLFFSSFLGEAMEGDVELNIVLDQKMATYLDEIKNPIYEIPSRQEDVKDATDTLSSQTDPENYDKKEGDVTYDSASHLTASELRSEIDPKINHYDSASNLPWPKLEELVRQKESTAPTTSNNDYAVPKELIGSANKSTATIDSESDINGRAKISGVFVAGSAKNGYVSIGNRYDFNKSWVFDNEDAKEEKREIVIMADNMSAIRDESIKKYNKNNPTLSNPGFLRANFTKFTLEDSSLNKMFDKNFQPYECRFNKCTLSLDLSEVPVEMLKTMKFRECKFVNCTLPEGFKFSRTQFDEKSLEDESFGVFDVVSPRQEIKDPSGDRVVRRGSLSLGG